MEWRKLKLLMLLAGVLFCVGMAVVSVRWGLADYHADIAYQEMQSWGEGDITEASWQRVHQQMIVANELSPGSAVYLHRLGRLLSIRTAMEPDQKELIGRQGLDYFERALLVRGQWPATWSELAMLKHVLGEHDARFEEAIANATRYGPWEPGVLRQIAIVGTASWAGLPASSKVDVLGNIERGLRTPSADARVAVAAAIKSDASGSVADLVHGVGEILLEQDWLPMNRLLLADLTLAYWPLFLPEHRRLLTPKVAQVIAQTQNPSLIRQLEESGRFRSICPYLPMNDKFVRLCKDKKLNNR